MPSSEPHDTWVPRPRRRETPLGLLGHGVKFLGYSTLAGVLLAGIALPAHAARSGSV